MIASGVVLSSFQSLAIAIAIERDDGTLKRLRGTPMPPAAYFLGKVGLVAGHERRRRRRCCWSSARCCSGSTLPTDAGAVADLRLGLRRSARRPAPCSASPSPRVPRSARSAPAVVSPVVLVLQFISGVFFVFSDLPGWMRGVASVFPLKWMAQGMRSVFLPESFERPGGRRVLAARDRRPSSWPCGASSAWCSRLRTFRWRRRDAG